MHRLERSTMDVVEAKRNNSHCACREVTRVFGEKA